MGFEPTTPVVKSTTERASRSSKISVHRGQNTTVSNNNYVAPPVYRRQYKDASTQTSISQIKPRTVTHEQGNQPQTLSTDYESTIPTNSSIPTNSTISTNSTKSTNSTIPTNSTTSTNPTISTNSTHYNNSTMSTKPTTSKQCPMTTNYTIPTGSTIPKKSQKPNKSRYHSKSKPETKPRQNINTIPPNSESNTQSYAISSLNDVPPENLLHCTFHIENKPVTLLIDTGAGISIIKRDKMGSAQLNNSDIVSIIGISSTQTSTYTFGSAEISLDNFPKF